MGYMNISLKARNLKCFGEKEQGFEEILPVNLIIGRNNSGKTALLDLVKYNIMPDKVRLYGHKGNNDPEVMITKELLLSDIELGFDRNVSGEGIPAHNHFDYGKHFEGARITLKHKSKSTAYEFVGLDADYIDEAIHYFQHIAQRTKHQFEGKVFRGISAERDIKPEHNSSASANMGKIADNGDYATTLVQLIVNKSSLDRSIIENDLLNDLNEILKPDARFERILSQIKEEDGVIRSHDEWEIFLEEKNKGIISLTNSGSGLKTIILVLLHMTVLPKLENKDLSNFVFAFEELENNLHPGTLRKLLRYIENKAVDKGCIVFLTTHSNVMIDMFNGDKNAQILHVTNDGECAKVERVSNYEESKGILDDLDIRASDLLQTNGVIWVEGISDRIYIRKWIELFCEENNMPMPREDIHYSFIEYGGKCLNHYDFSAIDEQQAVDEDANILIKALKICRNKFVVMDSDKDKEDGLLRAAKENVKKECLDVWITEGREIENYIPSDIVKKVSGIEVEEFQNIAKVYHEKKAATFNKKDFALKVVENIDKNNWKMLDLEDNINKLIKKIFDWNNSDI